MHFQERCVHVGIVRKNGDSSIAADLKPRRMSLRGKGNTKTLGCWLGRGKQLESQISLGGLTGPHSLTGEVKLPSSLQIFPLHSTTLCTFIHYANIKGNWKQRQGTEIALCLFWNVQFVAGCIKRNEDQRMKVIKWHLHSRLFQVCLLKISLFTSVLFHQWPIPHSEIKWGFWPASSLL